MAKKNKIKIPKSVLDLRMSPKKFAKTHGIRIKGKGMSKKERKHNLKRLTREYSEHALNGLNKAVKILAENPDHKKSEKVKVGIENIISNAKVMKRVAKLYRKDSDSFKNLIFLPNMIMNTLIYYASDNISDEEKEIGKSLDTDALVEFCESILKKEIKRYKKMGLDPDIAYQMATIIPTAKLFKNSHQWYRQLIQTMYEIAAKDEVDIDKILKSVCKIDKKKSISKKDFLDGFFSTFILQKNSNKNAKFNEYQKDLHEGLIERTLVYMNDLKSRKLREMLKNYIKTRKKAESYKNDSKRVIKFTDHANSNSPYENIKKVVQELIADNSNNELYLS